MSVQIGLVLSGYHSLPKVLTPLSEELARCFLVIDVQAGVFRQGGMLEEANEMIVEKQTWPVAAFEQTSTLGLRPGSLPRLANALNVDECSYYFALDLPDVDALRRAEVLALHIGDFSESFLQQLDTLADLLIFHGDGCWEFYCGRADWYERLRMAWREIRERSLSDAGRAP